MRIKFLLSAHTCTVTIIFCTFLQSVTVLLLLSLSCTCSEHQALAQELQAQTDDSPTSAQLEKQLIQLEEQLESKASQIHTVRRQLDIAGKASKTGRAHKPDGGRATTAVLSVPASGEVLVTTTVRARRARQQQTPPPSGGGEWEGPVVRSDGGLSPRLEFLKKMKSLQNTLQQDDLSWN